MEHRRKVLVTGAGIAGPTLAYWLNKAGFCVEVIERAPKLRLGGQNIDVSDAAVEIVKMMGIESLIREHNTTEQGLKFVGSHGETKASFPKGTETSFTSEYEILRGDLSQILYDLSKSEVAYKFDDILERVHPGNKNVEVKFKSGASATYDLVIAADGVGSKTRELIFGTISPYKYLGVYTSYLTIPRHPADPKWARWYNAKNGRVILLRPDNKGTTRASVNFLRDQVSPSENSRAETVGILKAVLNDAGWEADRISRELETDKDIYLGPVSQVRLSRWSSGRCVLVGDAAYCPTPFTGMGTTLAMIGAYVLAGELAKTENHQMAFDRYEDLMRPFVEKIQRLPPGIPKIAYPKTKAGIFALNTAARLAASTLVQSGIHAIRAIRGRKKREAEFVLPSYSFGPTRT